MSGPYEDIINLPHHVSKNRQSMSMMDRAAQFSPFAALTGYDAAIEETGRLTEARIILDESEIQILNEKMRFIEEHIGERPQVSVTYFQPDAKKDGGEYVVIMGVVKKIDTYEQQIVMTDGVKIPIEDIIEIVDTRSKNIGNL